RHPLSQPLLDAGLMACNVSDSIRRDVVPRIVCGFAVGFNADDLAELSCKRQREESDSGVKINRRLSRVTVQRFGDQRFEQQRVALEKSRGAELVLKALDRPRKRAGGQAIYRRREGDALVPGGDFDLPQS